QRADGVVAVHEVAEEDEFCGRPLGQPAELGCELVEPLDLAMKIADGNGGVFDGPGQVHDRAGRHGVRPLREQGVWEGPPPWDPTLSERREPRRAARALSPGSRPTLPGRADLPRSCGGQV